MPLGIETGHLECEMLRRIADQILEKHRQFHFQVLPTPLLFTIRRSLGPGSPEYGLEEIREPGLRPGLGIGKTARGSPTGRWLERVFTMLLAVCTQLIVISPLGGILEHLVRLGHFLELGLGIRMVADIRVILASEATIGRLDGRLVGTGLHAEYPVVILEFHDHSSCDTKAA